LVTYAILSATLVTAISTAVLAVFALVQWRSLERSVAESAKARAASVILKVYDIMQDVRTDRRRLYGFPDDHIVWTREQLQVADHVCTELQRVAYLCHIGLVDPAFLVDGYAKIFVECWDKLQGYVEDLRARQGEPRELANGAYMRRHLELFALDCRKHLGIE
jgi:hypothetical protein